MKKLDDRFWIQALRVEFDRFWIQALRVHFGHQICDQIGPEKTLDLAAQKMVWLARKLVWEPKKPKN